MPTNKNEQYLNSMTLVETFSKRLNTLSWIWGGFSVDVYENRILREHDDLDYLTENLHGLLPQFIRFFENNAWQTSMLENGDLKVERECARIHLGHVELSDKARWTHNGDKGSIWFPLEWLNSKPVNFCGIEIHVVAPELQFVLTERPQMLNPRWKHREKDNVARKYLRKYMEGKRISAQSLFEQVSGVRQQPG